MTEPWSSMTTGRIMKNLEILSELALKEANLAEQEMNYAMEMRNKVTEILEVAAKNKTERMPEEVYNSIGADKEKVENVLWKYEQVAIKNFYYVKKGKKGVIGCFHKNRCKQPEDCRKLKLEEDKNSLTDYTKYFSPYGYALKENFE